MSKTTKQEKLKLKIDKLNKSIMENTPYNEPTYIKTSNLLIKYYTQAELDK